jgi:predicted transcriptional regulator
MHREQKTRAVLAEMGIPFESAAVSLKAAKEALLKCVPATKGEAITQDQLFEKACVPSRTTGRKALAELLSAGLIQRAGKGSKGNPFRYFLKA